MKLCFMTKRNTYGHRKYLFIDTEKKLFTYANPSIYPPDNTIEIKSKDMANLSDVLRENGYSMVYFAEWREG